MNKLITLVVVGLLSWNVYTTQQLTIDVAVVKNSVDFVLKDAYAAADARSEHRLLESRIEALEEKI